MLNKIKTILSNHSEGILITKNMSQRTTSSYPVIYKYDHGHILIPTSVFFPTKLYELQTNPSCDFLLVLEKKKQLYLTGRAEIDKSDFEHNWEIIQPLISQELESLYDLTSEFNFLEKWVIIDFIPSQIDYKTKEDKFSYHMEII